MTTAPDPEPTDLFAGLDRMRAKYSTLRACARDALVEGAPPAEVRSALQTVAAYADHRLHTTAVVRDGFAKARAT